jgi:hypothetical protein
MSSWWERSRKRDLEIAEGADADLLQQNRCRSKLAFTLIGLAVLIVYGDSKVHFPSKVSMALRMFAAVSFALGAVLAKWAQHEHSFLTRPDPEGPPEIFRDKP